MEEAVLSQQNYPHDSIHIIHNVVHTQVTRSSFSIRDSSFSYVSMVGSRILC